MSADDGISNPLNCDEHNIAAILTARFGQGDPGSGLTMNCHEAHTLMGLLHAEAPRHEDKEEDAGLLGSTAGESRAEPDASTYDPQHTVTASGLTVGELHKALGVLDQQATEERQHLHTFGWHSGRCRCGEVRTPCCPRCAKGSPCSVTSGSGDEAQSGDVARSCTTEAEKDSSLADDCKPGRTGMSVQWFVAWLWHLPTRSLRARLLHHAAVERRLASRALHDPTSVAMPYAFYEGKARLLEQIVNEHDRGIWRF